MKTIFGILFALLLVVSLGLVTAAPVLAGTTIHVPSDYATIQEAIDAAGSGDTIMVAVGTYAAFQVIDKDNIHIIGTEGATVTNAKFIKDLPVVGSAWVMAAVYDSEDVNIEDINFDGTGVSGKGVFVGIAYVDSTGTITDLTVENIIATDLGAGVAIIGDVGSSTVEMTRATISSNDNVGIYVCGGSTLKAHLNKIVHNAECGLLNDGGETVDAIGNWWGDKSGPLHQTNPFGRGNAVVGDVDFKPWLEAELVTETVSNKTVDAILQADTEVVVKGKATIAIAKYSSNPHPTLSSYAAADSSDLAELKIYIDVAVSDFDPGTAIQPRLYYTDAKAESFNETSLQLFWFNGTKWEVCSSIGVNTTDITKDNRDYSGYMWAEIRETGTTPTLAQLTDTPFGGYGHPTEKDCFIATAAYGTDTAKEIDILREFRDKVLLPNSLGARLIYLYYEIHRPIADFISQHEVARTAVRVGFVDPIVAILNWSHDLWSVRRL
jgi:hypothetical protein